MCVLCAILIDRACTSNENSGRKSVIGASFGNGRFGEAIPSILPCMGATPTWFKIHESKIMRNHTFWIWSIDIGKKCQIDFTKNVKAVVSVFTCNCDISVKLDFTENLLEIYESNFWCYIWFHGTFGNNKSFAAVCFLLIKNDTNKAY